MDLYLKLFRNVHAFLDAPIGSAEAFDALADVTETHDAIEAVNVIRAETGDYSPEDDGFAYPVNSDVDSVQFSVPDEWSGDEALS